jgi:two-component system phosphate regulon sensor histidine kinase PhoR
MGTLTGRIFRSILFTSIAVVLLTGVLFAGLTYAVLDDQLRRELLNTTDVIERALPVAEDEEAYLEGLVLRDIRVTWIAADGSVLHDSVATGAAELENHLDRPEVKEALSTGSGIARRHSNTLDEETVYAARLLSDGTILRVAGTQRSIFGHMAAVLVPGVLVLLALTVVAVLVARFTARRMLRPLDRIDFEQPLANEAYPELAPLLTRLNVSRREIIERNAQLDARRSEFDAVTGSMREGLVLSDAQGRVLSINAAAAELFDVSADDVIGRHLLTLSRSSDVQRIVDSALLGERATGHIEQDGRVYRLLASPVLAGGEAGALAGGTMGAVAGGAVGAVGAADVAAGGETGAVGGATGGDAAAGQPGVVARGAALLALDITEWYRADLQRREFTANVSHELKTPLTVINGYAELMERGMVEQGDVLRFARLIHDEGTRLITLVDDIITLSQLDEKEDHPLELTPFEEVDLAVLAREVTDRLASFARGREVTLVLRPAADDVTVLGIPVLVSKMLYNLVENGIRYTNPGGEVTVDVAREADVVVASVRDSGIGIPAELHDKVFERFFCADRSRSRETGGTGLGLAIVKHGALVHNADITLQSAEAQGTTIQLRFPT